MGSNDFPNPTGVRDFFSFFVWARFLSSAIAQKELFGIFIQHFNLPHLNHYICLILLSGQSLLVTPSLTCSFAAIFTILIPHRRPAPIWPCSSVGRATVVCSGGRGFESHLDQEISSQSFSMWAQKVSFGILLKYFNLTYFYHELSLSVLNSQTLLVTRVFTLNIIQRFRPLNAPDSLLNRSPLFLLSTSTYLISTTNSPYQC